MYYIDNDSARYGLIRGLSDKPTSMTMLAQFWDQDSLATANPWFARVPSCANPADEPSRGEAPMTLCKHSPKPIHPTERSIPPEWEKELARDLQDAKEFVISEQKGETLRNPEGPKV